MGEAWIKGALLEIQECVALTSRALRGAVTRPFDFHDVVEPGPPAARRPTGREPGCSDGHLDSVTDKIDRGEGTVGRLVNDTVLYDRLSSLAARLEELTTRLGQGQGTAGQLLQDRQLYENMNGAASELRSLIAEIKKNPRKYLNVKLSVF